MGSDEDDSEIIQNLGIILEKFCEEKDLNIYAVMEQLGNRYQQSESNFSMKSKRSHVSSVRSAKKRKTSETSMSTIKTANGYELLNQVKDSDLITTDMKRIPRKQINPKIKATKPLNTDGINANGSTSEKVKTSKPPPIVIPTIDTNKLDKMMKKNDTHQPKYTVKITKGNQKIVQCEELEGHKAIFHLLKTEKVDSHTYTPKELKKITILCKGVQHTFSTDEIKEDILRQLPNVEDLNVKIFETPRSKQLNIKLNAHIIQFSNENVLSHIRKIKYICYHKITWEQLKRSSIVQCMKCQRPGHVAQNCNYGYRCVKCKNQHEPGQCKQQKNEATAPYCVNCEQTGHPANYKGCSELKNIEKRMKLRRRQQSRIRQQIHEQNLFSKVSAAAAVTPGVSFAQAIQGHHNSRQPKTDKSNQNVSNLNFNLFAKDECSNLFGCDLFSLITKVNNFIPSYSIIQNTDEKQAAYLSFVFSLCLKE